jgi:predicted NAD/FAD-dependent oxidoreductase
MTNTNFKATTAADVTDSLIQRWYEAAGQHGDTECAEICDAARYSDEPTKREIARAQIAEMDTEARAAQG